MSNNDEICHSEWRGILELDLGKFSETAAANSLLDIKLRNPEPFLDNLLDELKNRRPCSIVSNHPLFPFRRGFIDSCHKSQHVVKNQQKYGRSEIYDTLYQCLENLMNYRLSIVQHLTKNIPLQEISDPGTLVNMFLATGFLSDEVDMERLSKIAGRIAEVNRSDREAIGYSLRALYLDLKYDQENTEKREHLETAIEEATRKSFEDDIILEAKLNFLRLKHDIPAMRALAQDIRSGRPDSFLSDYYLAWADYLEGDLDQAMITLKPVLEKEGVHRRVQETLRALEKLKKGIAVEEIFTEGELGVIPGPGYAIDLPK